MSSKRTKYDDKTKQLIEEALRLNREEKYVEALTIFKNIHEQVGESPVVIGMIASILYSGLNRSEEALPYAKRSIQLSPKSETASLCLALCLFELDRKEEMEEEIRRYLGTGKELDLYNTLFEENNLTKEDFM